MRAGCARGVSVVKPALTVVSGSPAPVSRTEAVQAARKRFGKPFAHEPGSNYEPRATRVLTEWMAKRLRDKAQQQ
jgi:hypothetical protein